MRPDKRAPVWPAAEAKSCPDGLARRWRARQASGRPAGKAAGRWRQQKGGHIIGRNRRRAGHACGPESRAGLANGLLARLFIGLARWSAGAWVRIAAAGDTRRPDQYPRLAGRTLCAYGGPVLCAPARRQAGKAPAGPRAAL